jgi:O-antigen/teichoic acid export membrane protein
VPAAVILFGSVWREAGYATMTLAAGMAAGTVISFASEVLKADGHPELLTKVHIVLFTCSLIAALALLPVGMIGVAAGMSVGSIAASVYSLGQVRRHNEIRFPEFARAIVPALVAALVMAGLITALEFLVIEADTRGTVVGLLLILAQAGLGLLIYSTVMALLDRQTVREMRDLVGGALPRRRT